MCRRVCVSVRARVRACVHVFLSTRAYLHVCAWM